MSVGEAGIWGVNVHDDIYFRNGVTDQNPSGTSWSQIAGKLKQIDSGPSGIVYGVNVYDNIYCRTGIGYGKPFGTGWKHIGGKLKYISCGVLGCWGVNSADDIFYRSGVTKENCGGTAWSHIPGKLKQIEVGKTGDVYGVNFAGDVYRRTGIFELHPTGSGWQKIEEGSHVTTGLNEQYLLVNGQIHYSNGRYLYENLQPFLSFFLSLSNFSDLSRPSPLSKN